LFELENAEGGSSFHSTSSILHRYLQRQGGSFFLRIGWCSSYSNQTVHAVGGTPSRETINTIHWNYLRVLPASICYPANDQFIGQFVASIHPGAVILWGRPCCELQDELCFVFCIFEFREILLPTEGLTPCLRDPSHCVLSFCILDNTWNSNTIGCQFSRYWKRLLVWWLMYLVAPLLFHTTIYSIYRSKYGKPEKRLTKFHL
jgi:hypothetical protein